MESAAPPVPSPAPPRRGSPPSARRPPWRLGLGLLAAAVVLLLVAIVRPRLRAHERFVAGFWDGEPSFMREAGLGGLHMVLDDAASGFVVMLDPAGEPLATKHFVLTPRRGPADWAAAVRGHFAGGGAHARAMRLSFDDEPEDEGPFPARLDVVADPAAGTLAFASEGELYALFTKDYGASLAAGP